MTQFGNMAAEPKILIPDIVKRLQPIEGVAALSLWEAQKQGA